MLRRVFQDKIDKNYSKGDFVFQTEHVVELVAKVTSQMEARQDLVPQVNVTDTWVSIIKTWQTAWVSIERDRHVSVERDGHVSINY